MRQQAASPPHTDGSVVFAMLRQYAPRLIHGSLGPPEYSTQTAARSVQPFLHSSQQSVPVLYNRLSFPFFGVSGAHLIHDSLGLSESTTQKASWLLQQFLYSKRQCSYTLQWTTHPPQNCLFPWGSGPPSSMCFLWPTRILNPNGISIC